LASYRPEFEAALRLLARMGEEMAATGYSRPVLVGGAAVEYYSQSAIGTGDFDLCTPWQEAFEAIMQRHGFIRPSGPGKATRGWIHPELALGFEIVASVPMDGSVDREHILLLEDFSEEGSLAIISVEDLIADRMGQYASGSASGMHGQARALLRLHPDADMHYLERRIREETGGDHGVEDIAKD
jgi:hypothetical protein